MITDESQQILHSELLLELIACSVDELIPVSEIIKNEIETNQGEVSDIRIIGFGTIAKWLESISARSVAPGSQIPGIAHLASAQRKLHTLTSVVFPEASKMYLVEFKDVQGLIMQVLANNNTTPDELQIKESFIGMDMLDKTITGFADIDVADYYPKAIPF